MKTGKITYFGITIGAIASAYVSYVLNGVWSKGMDITTFTDTFLFQETITTPTLIKQ